MACPCFFPLERLEGSHGRAPLGDLYMGDCRAGGHPDQSRLRECCNFGYARGRCPAFPGGELPDAVRFALAADSGSSVRILWSRELNHLPHSNGVLDLQVDAAAPAGPEEVFYRQARSYLESYLRRKPERGRAQSSDVAAAAVHP